jgi:phage terminase small subunit
MHITARGRGFSLPGSPAKPAGAGSGRECEREEGAAAGREEVARVKKNRPRAKKPAKKADGSASIKLSAQHEKFCQEYVACYHKRNAALRAGYSEKSAHVAANRLLKNDKVLARVRELQEDQLREIGVSKPDVLIRITRIMRREEVEHVVAYEESKRRFKDEKGNPVTEEIKRPVLIEVPTQLRDALKAGELMGKHFGLFEDQQPQDKGPTIIDDIPDPGCVANG